MSTAPSYFPPRSKRFGDGKAIFVLPPAPANSADRPDFAAFCETSALRDIGRLLQAAPRERLNDGRRPPGGRCGAWARHTSGMRLGVRQGASRGPNLRTLKSCFFSTHPQALDHLRVPFLGNRAKVHSLKSKSAGFRCTASAARLLRMSPSARARPLPVHS